MTLYDAAYDPVVTRTADALVNALLLVAAAVILAGVILLVLRKRRRSGKKGKDERPEDK